jgi:hypothetical protein
MAMRFGPVVFISGTNSGRYLYCNSLFVDAGSDREFLADLRENERIDSVWLSHGQEEHFKDLDLFGDYDLWDRYLCTIDEREAKLLDVLSTPRTMLEIIEANILYGKKRVPQDFYNMGERGHMGKHLDRLIEQGTVLLEDGTYRLARG